MVTTNASTPPLLSPLTHLRAGFSLHNVPQGSAADLIKLAMCRWADWQDHAGSGCSPATPPPPWAQGLAPARAVVVAQIHDELLFECDAQPATVAAVATAVQHIMCGVTQLQVRTMDPAGAMPVVH